ncbi:MAG: C40 family peptidase [Bacteroidales bacterium]|jgi:lipoprotein Spr|nr:C40 family peptidase [Bacteroidales bacterium]
MFKHISFFALFILVFVFLFYSCSSTKGVVNNRDKVSYYNSKEKKEENKKGKKENKKEKKDNKKQKDKLAQYCSSWLGVPHKLGGNTKKGVDCSGFVIEVYKEIYGISLPRTASDMANMVDKIKDRKDLKQGDLVFFKGNKSKINHVGIFLEENSFIHTSTSKGVMISSMDDIYWSKHYLFGGRHPKNK